MAKRNYRQVHDDYLIEFLASNYPAGSWKTNVQLGDVKVPEGTTLSESEQRFVKKPFRPVADAVVILQYEVHIIEAKIREERGKVEQLLIYEYLFPRTPEYQAFKDFRIRKLLVTPKDQGEFAKFLFRYGIEVVYFRPLWIEQYLGSLDVRYRRGHYYSTMF